MSGRIGSASGQNFGERDGGKKSWIIGGGRLSMVCTSSRADSPTVDRLTPAPRDYMGGLCVKEPTPGRRGVDRSDCGSERGWEDRDKRTSGRVGGG